MAQAKSVLGGERAEFRSERAEQIVEREFLVARHEGAAVEARDVEQSAEKRLGCLERAVQVPSGVAPLVVHARRERVREQLCRVQRLHEVVADRREETRLRLVRAFGLARRLLERARAFGDALLERFVRARERLCGVAERGDVGERRHEAAAGHRIAAYLDLAAVGEAAFGNQRRARAHVREAPLHARCRVAGADRAALDRVTHQFLDRPTHREHAGGILEQFGVATVPGDDAQIRIDDADALRHVLERGEEHALVEAQVGRGLVDDRGERVELAATLAPRDIEQKARRRRADDGRQFVFDDRAFARVGMLAIGAAADHCVDAFRRQEARCQRAQFAALEFVRDRQRGDALATEQRDERNAEEIRREADDDRARERREVRQTEEVLGCEPGDAERAGRGPVGRGEHQAREENVQPQHGAGSEADERGTHAEHRPVDRNPCRRRETRERRKRQRADIGEGRVADQRAAVCPREQDDDEDRRAAGPEHVAAQVALAALAPAGAHAHRRDEMVRDHEAQRERRHDDHARRRRKAAEKSDQREPVVSACKRQREHVQVGRDAGRGEARLAEARERQDRQRDQHHVQRKQPACGL